METGDTVCPVVAYVDNGRVVCYHNEGDSEICLVNKCEHFFDSKQQGEQYIRDRIEYLKRMSKDVKDVLSEVYEYERIYAGAEHAVTLKDMIPDGAVSLLQDKSEEKALIRGLVNCLHSRTLEVAKHTIPLDSISHIEWQTCYATVVLHSGQRVVVSDIKEEKLLEAIFNHK